MKKLFIYCSIVFALIGSMAFNAMATPIVGAISFSGTVVTDNPDDMLLAKAFTSFTDVTVAGAGTGAYGSVAAGQAVTFTPFTFDPALYPNPLAPLWAFNVQEKAYSFDATGLIIEPGRSSHMISMYGSGIAHIDAYDDTPGNWYFTAQRAGQTASFSASTEVAPVPEPATMLLLGSGLVGLASFSRKKIIKK